MEKDQVINLNQNSVDCLKTIHSFGSQTVQNICTGKSVVVPWGSVDWTICFALIAGGLVLSVIFLGMGIRIVFD